MPIPTIPGMPGPADPASADGYDAFNDSVVQADANFALLPPWSQTIVEKTYTGVEYGIGAITVLTGWTCEAFLAVKMDRIITIDATFTYTGAGFTSAADCIVSPRVNIFTLPTALRPVFWAPALNARLANTAAHIIIGYPTTDVVAVDALAVPSRAIATGSQLYLHAAYADQTFTLSYTP
jgi:hypothetical protein